MEKYLVLIATYLFCTTSFALSPLPAELKDEKNWNQEYLEKLHQEANDAISPADFEEYKYLPQGSKRGAHQYEALGQLPAEISEYNSIPLDYLYNNTCRVYGAQSVEDSPSNWSLSSTRVFRFTSQQAQKLDQFYKHKTSTKEFIFVGGSVPHTRDLRQISKVFTSTETPNEINITVNENDMGIYSDIGQDINYSFRKTNGLLVTKFSNSTKTLGYAVCYKKEAIFCSAKGTQEFYYKFKDDILPSRINRMTNMIITASDKQTAAKLYQQEYKEYKNDDCPYYAKRPVNEMKKHFASVNDLFRMQDCQAAVKALDNMVCANDIKLLNIKRSVSDDNGFDKFTPINPPGFLQFW